MTARIKHCDRERLRLLAEDRLNPSDLPELEEHLGTCEHCRFLLDEMASGDRWIASVRQHLGHETGDWHEQEPRAHRGVLDFLAPTDWPDSLGRMGTYEIKGVLGSGGMGVVLKAFDPALHRNVAIKVLSVALSSSGAARRRFLREARAAAAVAHEHVVAVHAVVESAGLPFLVMEYVPGRSLQDRLDKDGPLAIQEILRIGMQTAAGLAAAHAQGLVHRDVKPANILLENGVERVRLTDFGLARAAADAAVTQSGVVAGTPHYMAPEQARAEAVDHRADLFSLGSTLYAMCTGHPPFRADSAVAVLRRVSDDKPRPVREINPDVPDWLEAIIDRLHAKSAGDRFQSAREVAELLSGCLAHVREPLSVALPADAILIHARSRKRRRYSRHGLAASLGIVLVMGAVVAVSAWQSRGTYAPIGQRDRAFEPGQPLVRSEVAYRAKPDEIDEQIEAAHQAALLIEGSLTRPNMHSGHDSFSALANDASNQAEVLEHALVSGRGPAVTKFDRR